MKKGDVQIRVAELKDLTEIMVLVKEAVRFMHAQNNFQWDEEYPTPQAFEKDIEKGELYVLKNDGELAACVALTGDLSPEYSTVRWKTSQNALSIHRMIVSNRFKGEGLAQYLFRYAETIAQKYNYQSIWSDTNSKNKPMNHIFTSMGYNYVGDIVLRDNPDLFHCYEKSLR